MRDGLNKVETWIHRHMWVGRRRRIGISIWGKTDHNCYLPLCEYSGTGSWWVRLPFTRYCLAYYRRPKR